MSARTPYRPAPMPPELAPMMEKWTREVEAEHPRGRCRGCAFRPGTAANRCGNTAAKVAHIIVNGGDFRCHHAALGGPVVDRAPGRQCRGFRALMLRRMRVIFPKLSEAGFARLWSEE